jgi:Gluconate 2-dehydrogenase subunit 3
MNMNRRDAIKSSALFLGYAVSTTALSNLFISCQSEAKLDWKPVFLSNNQAQLITDMTDRILPRTKTPGAKDLGIDRFIDKMLKDLLTKAEQTDFISGLEAFEAACKTANGKTFVACTPQQQDAFLLAMDKEADKFPPSMWGISLAAGPPKPVPFFRRVKELSLRGYFTSQNIGEKVLSFDPMPGAYVACMPLSEIGNAWNE